MNTTNDKLPAEWQQLVDEYEGFGRSIVERCYALHSKLPKRLTESECYDLWLSLYRGRFDLGDWGNDINSGTDVIRRIECAHIRKQREPETVTFRAARNKDTKRVDMLNALLEIGPNGVWEWLEIDGKPQEFTVRIL